MTRAEVECATAGDQVKGGVAGRAVNDPGGETQFGVLAYPGDAEDRGDPVGEPHLDPVARAKRPQPEKEGRAVRLSTWPSITDAPYWPGVTEYLYHAASSALPKSDGTWIVPSGLTPSRSSSECTPMAGMSTETGIERRTHGPLPLDAIAPEAAADGCGAWSWPPTATPTAAVPATMRRTPMSPATRARGLTDGRGGGANLLWGQETTTRNPAMRWCSASPNAIPPRLPPACLTRVA